jgi:hypothetical protein
MDPHQQQLLTEIRALRQEVQEMHSKVTHLWVVLWVLLLVTIGSLVGGGAGVLAAIFGGLALFAFDGLVLRKSKSAT